MKFYEWRYEWEAMEALVARCHPERKPRDREWWSVVPTLVQYAYPSIHLRPEMIGYTQFTVAPKCLFGYDLGVHPDYRKRGLGTVLHAERLRIGARFGATMMFGVTEPANVAMRRLFDGSHMEEGELMRDYYRDVDPPIHGLPYAGGAETFAWAEAQPREWRAGCS